MLKADGLSKTSTEAGMQRERERAVNERKLSEIAAGLVVTRY